LTISFALVAHFMACGFVLMARVALLSDRPSWLDYNLHGPYTVHDLAGENGGGKVASAYIAAFYFCVTTMTTVG
jgi:hypothetical protein